MKLFDRRGLLMGHIERSGRTTEVRDRQGLLLGRVEDGKTYDRNGLLVANGDLSTFMLLNEEI